MLMITVEAGAGCVTLRLDGRLTGPEARELARYRMSRAFPRRRRVVLDVSGVLSVDREGREFLAEAHRRGDTLIGDATTSAIVASILASPGDDGSPEAAGPLHGVHFRNPGWLCSP